MNETRRSSRDAKEVTLTRATTELCIEQKRQTKVPR